ncbi:MAG: hypothetical protein QOJ17_1526, partial [Rhodospirillaceae bacterium]|nr:hypothetical protein [Rhodospirillaceae bacterium]
MAGWRQGLGGWECGFTLSEDWAQIDSAKVKGEEQVSANMRLVASCLCGGVEIEATGAPIVS